MVMIMKRLFTMSFTVLFVLSAFAQSPQKMSYQAVIRNSSNVLVTSATVGMRISILQGSATGTPVYVETQTPATNANGLVSIEIGGGAVVTGTFAGIDWSAGLYFIKTETAVTSPLTTYTITGTSQILSVPYALYAKTAESFTGTIAETDPVFIAHPANGITGIGIANWNTSYGWGNHAGLYRPVNYVPAWSEVTGKPVLATVAISGNYADLSNQPAIPTQYTDAMVDARVVAGITNKVDKVTGKGLSTNDYTTAEQAKLAAITGTNTGDQNITAMTHTNRVALDAVSGINSGDQILPTLSGLGGVAGNTPITGATKTKITYDTKGLVISGDDATTADIVVSADRNYITDAQLTVIDNTSGINSGDNATNTQYSGLVTNAAHSGDATGATALTVVGINGTSLAGLATGILKNTTSTGVPSVAEAGTDYLTPAGSAALLTDFPVLNQNTTGNAATVTTNANLTGEVTSAGNTTTISNSAVLGKVLTGFTSGAGTLAATDNILQAIQKLDGNVAKAHYIGESYGGGIVFYVYDNGQHGLIAATADQSTGITWGGSTVTNAVRNGVFAGQYNTERIIINQGGGTYASQVCANYQGGGYGDWYLPSVSELSMLNSQRAAVGSFASFYYWSSSEYSSTQAYSVVFPAGWVYYDSSKSTSKNIRAIRAF
jgi:hypothetical protein